MQNFDNFDDEWDIYQYLLINSSMILNDGS